jgi:hypothetical protein
MPFINSFTSSDVGGGVIFHQQLAAFLIPTFTALSVRVLALLIQLNKFLTLLTQLRVVKIPNLQLIILSSTLNQLIRAFKYLHDA